MRKKYIVLFFTLCVFTIASCFSQSVNEMMDANQKVFELVESYLDNSDLTRSYKQKINIFRSLFASPNTPVYMDHISWYNNSRRTDTTTLLEYSSYYEQHQHSFISYEIKDVRISFPQWEGDKMIYIAELTKAYVTMLTDSMVTSRLALQIECDPVKREALITKIECKRKDIRLQPHILANYIKEDKALYIPELLKVKMINGDTSYLDGRIQPLSAEVYKQLSGNNCATYRYAFILNKENAVHTISIKTLKNAVGLELGYMQALDGQKVLMPERDGFSLNSPVCRNMIFRIGVPYLRQLYALNRHRLSFETGVGLEICRSRFMVDSCKDRYQDIDVYGDSFEHLVCLRNYKETGMALSLDIPVTLRYDYFVIPKLSVFALVGLSGSVVFNRSAEVSFDGFYAGLYSENRRDENSGVFKADKQTLKVKQTMGWHLDALARLGAQYFFTSDNHWSAEVSVGYHCRFLSNVLKRDPDFKLSEDEGKISSIYHNVTTQPAHFLDFRVGIKYNF